MKIRRINDHTKVAGNVQRCELHLETTTQKGWRHHLDTGYDQFYPDKHWEEVPPEPEWVEVDLKDYHVLVDRTLFRKGGTAEENHLLQCYGEIHLRIDEGWVKVSEFEEWLNKGLASSVGLLGGFVTKGVIHDYLQEHQRPMLTVWEKKL